MRDDLTRRNFHNKYNRASWILVKRRCGGERGSRGGGDGDEGGDGGGEGDGDGGCGGEGGGDNCHSACIGELRYGGGRKAVI